MAVKNIFFDLDGTLTDPKFGITKSIQYALKKLGRDVPEIDDLLWCIGPPLRGSFKKILEEDDAMAEIAIGFYREYYIEKGKFENEIYSGIAGVLEKLNQQDFNLFVVTSKPYIFAIEIIKHFDILRFFKSVYGSELDGRLVDKGELIAHALGREKIPAEKTIMVGDREHDIIGAKKNGVLSLGVTYGYGTKEELKKTNADFIADSPEDIFYIANKQNSGRKNIYD